MLIKEIEISYIAGLNRAAETAETYFAEINTNTSRQRLASRKIIIQKPISAISLRARLDHARWIVDCPFCGNAEFMWEDGLFFCSICGNKDTNGQLKKVIMPTQRKKIEDLLSPRKPSNRNWHPSEKINDLMKENKLHNVGVG